MTQEEFADAVHMEIHAVRRLPNYKPTIMEKNISKLVLEHFTTCKECQEVKEKIKNQPTKKSFLQKLGDVADGS